MTFTFEEKPAAELEPGDILPLRNGSPSSRLVQRKVRSVERDGATVLVQFEDGPTVHRYDADRPVVYLPVIVREGWWVQAK